MADRKHTTNKESITRFGDDCPLVSVIVPIHNREDTVRKTLENVKENNYRPLEMILVDDGSEDNVRNVLENFKRSAENETLSVKIIVQKNYGASSARNAGVEHVTGEYIQFLDSDDFIDTNKFELQIDAMKSHNAQLAVCDFKMVHVDREEETYCSNALMLRKVLHASASFGCGSPLLHKNLIDKLTWNTALKKKQDVDYFLRAALLADKIVHVERSLYSYMVDTADKNRISASYMTTKPVYKARINSLRNTKVPPDMKLFKKKAIDSLRRDWLKFIVKDKWTVFRNMFWARPSQN